MPDKVRERHFRNLYSMLLRLYPRAFRDKFAEGMTQTFHDLCREREESGPGLLALGLWIFFETLAGIARENIKRMNQLGRTTLRVALMALALLMVPLVSSRLVDGWKWGAGAFVIVYLLLFGTGMAYAVIARKMGAWTYKAGVGVALAAGLALGWSNMVHVADSENPANLAYYSVLAVGVVGALLARLEARGLARTLFAMAGTLAVIAVLLPSGAPPYLARNMAIGHGVFVTLFIASGLLFWRASLGGVKEEPKRI